MDDCLELDGHRTMIQQQVNESNRLVTFFQFNYYIVVVAHFVSVLYFGMELMWPAWFPVDYANSRFWFYIVSFYQLVASFFNAYVFTSIDLFAIVLYKLFGAHLDVLAMRLASVGHWEFRAENKREKSIEQQRLITDMELRKCIKYHILCSR